MTSEVRFDDQVTIVTGAARGLGRTYAVELARRGSRVIVNDLSDEVAEVVEEIADFGGTAVAHIADVATADGGASIVQAAVDSFGTVHALINNAGFARNAPFASMGIAEFDAVIGVHLRGAFFVTQPAWRIMQTQGYGRIVMTSSASGVFGRPAGANYCSAKAGIVGLTKALAAEGADHGIHTNCLLPIATTEFVAANPLPPAQLEALSAALGGVAGRKEPERVTPLAVYLASRGCSSNGQVYSSCLGRYALGFVGVTEGWISPGDTIPGAEEIAMNLPAIEALEGIAVPASSFDEMAIAARAVAGVAGRSGDELCVRAGHELDRRRPGV
jgi:NAD(P)-dependent dehydrogenase (short-subunit alcohol dehydrogenase family)